jgi:acyl carrier protein
MTLEVVPAARGRIGLEFVLSVTTLPPRMGPPQVPSKAQILQKIQEMMRELFELDADRVQPAARLIEDLELDSLDAFDLAVKVEEITGVAFDEAKIRELVTVADVVDALEAIARTQDVPALRSSAPADP